LRPRVNHEQAAAGEADNQDVKECPLDAEVIAVPPGSPEGRAVAAYYRDIVSRYHGREATSSEVADAMNAEPSDDLAPARAV
jgi:hypothetical protein